MIPRPQRSVTSIAGFGHSASFESQLLEAAEDEAEAGLAAAASVDSVQETQSEAGAVAPTSGEAAALR